MALETTPVGSVADPYLNGDANFTAVQLLQSLGINNVSFQTGQTGIGTFNAVPGPGEALVALGNTTTEFNENSYSGPKPLILVGNDAGDTFDVAGLNNVYVVEGAGNDTVNASGSDVTLATSTGTVLVNASGNDTINQFDPLQDKAKVTIDLANNGVLHLGTTGGNDTVHALGSATVYGGTGSFVFDGASGSNSVVHGGTGNETLFGGSDGSTNTFYAGGGNDALYGGSASTNSLYASSGSDTLYGGTNANNTFYAGTGHDTMVAGTEVDAGLKNVFDFNSSVHGGSTVVYGASDSGFASGADQIVLQGYTAGDVKTWLASGGNTYIGLSDGTTIKLSGVSIQDETTAANNGYITFK